MTGSTPGSGDLPKSREGGNEKVREGQWQTERTTTKDESKAEREGFFPEAEAETLFERIGGDNGVEGVRDALAHAYETGYLKPTDHLDRKVGIISVLQDLAPIYGSLGEIPPEELAGYTDDKTTETADIDADSSKIETTGSNEGLDKFASNLIADNPDLKGNGHALVDAMLGELDPQAPDHAEKANILLSIRLLLGSERTAGAVQAALDNGAAFDTATLRTIAVDYFADPSVAEEQKSELRERLGIAEAMPHAKGRIPASPKEFEKQLIARGTVQRQVKITHPDGTVTYETETERSLEPIVYSNNGMPIEFHPDLNNPKEWAVKVWRASGPPIEFPVSTEDMLRGLSSIDWALAYQSLEAAGYPYFFGGGHSLEERGHMERQYHIFTYGLGLQPPPGEMWTEAHTRKTEHWMQSMNPRGDWAQGDLDVVWQKNVERLGLYDTDTQQWNLKALNWARTRLVNEFATTGAPEYENLLNIMVEGGFGERANEAREEQKP